MDKKRYNKPKMKIVLLSHPPLLQTGSPDPGGEGGGTPAPEFVSDEE
jgi:hypothetical protein